MTSTERWRITRVASTGSTNADLAALARGGEAEGAVLIADTQTAGRGRLNRSWVSPPGSSIACSVLVRPPVPAKWWSWLPLLAGLAIADGVTSACPGLSQGPGVRLKWPNDVLIGESKICGVLAETVLDRVVLGFGINVNLSSEELPVATSTSLALATGAPVDREQVVQAVLEALSRRLAQWADAGGDPHNSGLAEAYRLRCSTIGQLVRVQLPRAEVLLGTAIGLDVSGCLLVREGADDRVAVRTVAAGDVVHVRRA